MNRLEFYLGEHLSQIVDVEVALAPTALMYCEYINYRKLRFRELVNEWTSPWMGMSAHFLSGPGFQDWELDDMVEEMDAAGATLQGYQVRRVE